MSDSPPEKRSTNWPLMLVIGCVGFFALIFICGVVSAIAIPNFAAYKDRAAQQR